MFQIPEQGQFFELTLDVGFSAAIKIRIVAFERSPKYARKNNMM